MKVLLVNTSEHTGGAAVACNRLMKALQSSGVEAKMLVRDKQTDDNNVISVNDSWFACKINRFRFLWERFVIWWINCFTRKNLFAVSIANTGIDISKRPEVQEADVIHLHWVNQGFLSLEDIEKLTKLGKPIVWTMHDMWTFTGICHYAGDCKKYSDCCSSCPLLKNPSSVDLSSKIWYCKKHLFTGISIEFVACSQWLKNLARQSELLRNSQIVNIPNPIDSDIFKPLDKNIVRKSMGLPVNKKLLLFGADRIDDERKGFVYLVEALNLLAQRYTLLTPVIEIVVFGKLKCDIGMDVPFKIHNIGYIKGERNIVDMYNCADMFIIPSLEDNLPNTIMESMACGTPVVGFNVGGIPEMVDHKVNGYIADYKSSVDLMEGINWVLEQPYRYQKLSSESRLKVLNCYTEQIVGKYYSDLYLKLLK